MEATDNKLNLILDFNNFAMRSMFTCSFMDPDIMIRNFDTQEECNILMEKILIDMCKVIRTFKPKRVIISCDSKNPWRNDIYKDIDGETYKGTRTKDDKKNWKKIYATLDDLKSIMKDYGFIVTLIDRAEADDITTLWKEYLFDKGEDVVIVSSDMDWTQLVGMNDKGNVCICFNPISNNKGRKQLRISQQIKEWLDIVDKKDIFFRNYNLTKQTINSLPTADPKIDIEIIDPDKVLLDKIMAGDRSDNIPAFWFYYRNGKKQNVTSLKASHVFESLKINNIDDLIKANDDYELKDALEKEMKQEIELDFKERMMRQRKLVELKSDMFPKNIIKSFINTADDDMKSFNMNTSAIKADDILRNSKYQNLRSTKSEKLNSIFDDIKTLDKYSSNSKSLFD